MDVPDLLGECADDLIEKFHVAEGLIGGGLPEGLQQGRVEVWQVDVVLHVVRSGRGSGASCACLKLTVVNQV